ncbi:MAG: IS1634 family transposase, partial [Planctomycetes bacterium]|nr:IS1634 family transposase [Planctomycetota bacterium]
MYIDIVPNRSSPPAVLLREAWREGKRTHKRTVANLSSLPMDQVQQFRRVLKGETLVSADDAFEILRARPHGDVAAVVGTMHKLGVPELLSTRKHPKRQLVLAMIAARILDPCSKLATAQKLDSGTLSGSLGEVLGIQ